MIAVRHIDHVEGSRTGMSRSDPFARGKGRGDMKEVGVKGLNISGTMALSGDN